jgi:SAM-dependent methyltransferase
MEFYGRVLRELLDDGSIDRGFRTLVVCGGMLDRDTLLAAGFCDVTISNLDARTQGDAYAPFAWSFQDAESLGFPDASFDLAVVHAGLHHCQSPHRALLEMWRVARRAVLAFESRDSLAMRAACALGLAARYEVEAVADNGYRFGGMRNSSIPNYIYRWTEREVRKTIDCASPHAHHAYRFFYQFRPPTRRLAMHRSRAVRLAGRVLDLGAGLLEPIAARQGNLFAFFVRKPSFPDDLHPWLRLEDGTVVPDRAWCEARLDPGGAVRR